MRKIFFGLVLGLFLVGGGLFIWQKAPSFLISPAATEERKDMVKGLFEHVQQDILATPAESAKSPESAIFDEIEGSGMVEKDGKKYKVTKIAVFSSGFVSFWGNEAKVSLPFKEGMPTAQEVRKKSALLKQEMKVAGILRPDLRFTESVLVFQQVQPPDVLSFMRHKYELLGTEESPGLGGILELNYGSSGENWTSSLNIISINQIPFTDKEKGLPNKTSLRERLLEIAISVVFPEFDYATVAKQADAFRLSTGDLMACWEAENKTSTHYEGMSIWVRVMLGDFLEGYIFILKNTRKSGLSAQEIVAVDQTFASEKNAWRDALARVKWPPANYKPFKEIPLEDFFRKTQK